MKKEKIKILIIDTPYKKNEDEIYEKEIDAWIVNRNFAAHKSIGRDMWTVTLISLGIAVREFYTKKEAVFFARWANWLRVPIPWKDVTVENSVKNTRFMLEKDLEYISKWLNEGEKHEKD